MNLLKVHPFLQKNSDISGTNITNGTDNNNTVTTTVVAASTTTTTAATAFTTPSSPIKSDSPASKIRRISPSNPTGTQEDGVLNNRTPGDIRSGSDERKKRDYLSITTENDVSSSSGGMGTAFIPQFNPSNFGTTNGKLLRTGDSINFTGNPNGEASVMPRQIRRYNVPKSQLKNGEEPKLPLPPSPPPAILASIQQASLILPNSKTNGGNNGNGTHNITGLNSNNGSNNIHHSHTNHVTTSTTQQNGFAHSNTPNIKPWPHKNDPNHPNLSNNNSHNPNHHRPTRTNIIVNNNSNTTSTSSTSTTGGNNNDQSAQAANKRKSKKKEKEEKHSFRC